MAIKKLDDVRLNVKPIFLTLYHEYVFEGPCRFGDGMQLEKEFDLMMAAEKFKGWYKQLQDQPARSGRGSARRELPDHG